MENICEKCGREYKRTYCEFCVRESRWSPDKTISLFPPRLQKDLQTLNIQLDDYSIEDVIEGKGFHLRGPTGSGKTLYAATLTVDIIRQGVILQRGPQRFAFVTVPDLMEDLKSGFHTDKTSELLEQYRMVDWLVLDDLGVGKPTEWALGVLYLLINYRYEYLLPTVFTTNLDGDQLAEKFGDDRIPSRIIAMTATKVFTKQTDYRLKN